MANSYFQFKKFTIHHDLCAMKVGTDGVLLGAWSNIKQAKNILDIGTGTGLIAMMLAQRGGKCIDAIDIDASAVKQAKVNVCESPFAEHISITHTSFDDYIFENTLKYDLIVSNPPYFEQSLKCPDKQRSLARHNDELPLEELIAGAKQLLNKSGRLCLVLPFSHLERVEIITKEHGLYISRLTKVLPTPTAQAKRILVEITYPASQDSVASLEVDELVIEIARHQYTAEYIALTQNFYLKM